MPTVLITYDALFGGSQAHVERLRQAGFAVGYPDKRLTTEVETLEALRGAVKGQP